MSEEPLYLARGRAEVVGCEPHVWPATHRTSVRSFRFFELPTQEDTATGSVEMPCFLSDHIKPPCTEDCGRNRLKGILNRASKRFLEQPGREREFFVCVNEELSPVSTSVNKEGGQ